MRAGPFDFFVQFHVTEKCNLRCRHCYQSVTAREMSLLEIRAALDNVGDAIRGWATDYEFDVSPSLHITGGEPLVRRDIFDVVEHGRARGFTVSLMSNGTLVDADRARRIKASGVADVQVSIEGLEETHDFIRGDGSFRKALAGIANLVAQGVDTNLNVTVSRLNSGEVAELVALARGIGAGGVAFSRLVPTGGGESLSRAMLSSEEVAALYEEIRRYDGEGGPVVTSRDPLAAVAGIDGEIPQVEVPVGGCAAGMFGVTIGSDGTIMPCRRMDMPVGSILEQSFRDLWVESPVLCALRDRQQYHDGCDSCVYWPVCRGCRAIALAHSRATGGDDCLGPDPQCPYWRSTEAVSG